MVLQFKVLSVSETVVMGVEGEEEGAEYKALGAHISELCEGRPRPR